MSEDEFPSNSDGRKRLIVGLGNPGSQYQNTRHNLGFMVLSKLGGKLDKPMNQECCGAVVSEDDSLVLAMPQTFMNRSGYAVRCLAETRDAEPADILIVYDDIALPFGKLRLRKSGGPGGHRGMVSIIECLSSTAVPRLKLGIQPDQEPDDLADFVLSDFSSDEAEELPEFIGKAVSACESWLTDPIDVTMNRFNG